MTRELRLGTRHVDRGHPGCASAALAGEVVFAALIVEVALHPPDLGAVRGEDDQLAEHRECGQQPSRGGLRAGEGDRERGRLAPTCSGFLMATNPIEKACKVA